jgi:hypothetical protein
MRYLHPGWLLYTVIFFAGCPPTGPVSPPVSDADATVSPPPPQPVDGAIRTACERACDRAKLFDCEEGIDRVRCVAVCAHAEAEHVTDLHVECAANAKNVDEIKKCGGSWKCVGVK